MLSGKECVAICFKRILNYFPKERWYHLYYLLNNKPIKGNYLSNITYASEAKPHIPLRLLKQSMMLHSVTCSFNTIKIKRKLIQENKIVSICRWKKPQVHHFCLLIIHCTAFFIIGSYINNAIFKDLHVQKEGWATIGRTIVQLARFVYNDKNTSIASITL